MRGHMDCPDHTGDTCARCASAGYVIAGDPKIPLPWFLSPTPMTWTMMAGNLHQLAAAAVEECRDLAVTNPAGSRTIAQVIEAGRAHQDNGADLWLARRGAIYRIHAANVSAVVERFGKKLEGYEATGRPIFRVEDMTVKLDRMTETVTPRLAPVESTRIPGLFAERRGTCLTFKQGACSETWDVRTGQLVDASDTGAFPAATSAYIRERLAELLPAHRQKDEAASAPTETTSSNHATEVPAPIVGAPATHVKEGPMAIDLSNPAVVTAARQVARNIAVYLGIPALEARRTELRQNHASAEEAYRLAEAAVEKAKREVSALDAALKERDQELLLVVSEETVEEAGKIKKKYTADAAKASAVAARKTDEDYIAIKGALTAAKSALDAAELALAKAKAHQRALECEKDLLVAEFALATARVGAFAGLDGADPVPAAAPAAPVAA